MVALIRPETMCRRLRLTPLRRRDEDYLHPVGPVHAHLRKDAKRQGVNSRERKPNNK